MNDSQSRPSAGPVGLIFGIGLLLLAFGPLYLLAFRPVLRRLAVRNAVRRPRETFLVILGSLLGTAIITGSFVVGDTLGASFRQGAYDQLGPIDAVAASSGVDATPVVDKLRGLPPGVADGVLPIVTVGAAVSTVAAVPKAEPNARLVEVDFVAAHDFGGDPAATGIDGATPVPGHAVIGRDLAKTLGVDQGDTVEAYLYGSSVRLAVDRVLPRKGIAGVVLGGVPGSQSPNLFLAPGTIAELRGRPGAVGSPPGAYAAVSARGGVITDVETSDRLVAAMKRLVGSGPSPLAFGLPGGGVQVTPVKQKLLDFAKARGDQFTQLFGAIGSFSVLAGVLLLVNIFVMLAQERKTEMGMLRAVGMRRSTLVAGFYLEGWLYALASSFFGAIAGLGVGRLIVAASTSLFARGGGFVSIELHYSPNPASLVRGFMVGFALSIVTVLVTSFSITRLNVIRAIRDLPEPEVEHQSVAVRALAVVGVVLGLAMAVNGVRRSQPFGVLAGPGFMAMGIVALTRRRLPRRPVVTLATGAALVWNIAAFQLVPRAFRNGNVQVFVVQGVVLTGAAVAIVSQNQDYIGHFIRRIGGGSRSMALRLGLAYPLARRFRTAMILTMYALVMFTLTFVTIFSNLFGTQIDEFTKQVSGGFDVTLRSNPANPVPVDKLRAVPGVKEVAVFAQVSGEWKIDRTPDFEPWEAGTFDETWVHVGPTSLGERDLKFKSDNAAYRAVLASPDLVILPTFFLAGGGGPPEEPPEVGTTVQLRDPLSGRTKKLKVAGLSEGAFANRLPLMSPATLREVFGDRVAANQFAIAAASDTDPQELADRLNGAFIANGADGTSFRKLIDTNLSSQQGFFRLMQGYLALGLVVGIAGLGVVMVRAVRERRRQIGVLRALGFDGAAVRRAFVAESAFVAFEGVLLGAGLAIVTAWRLVGNDRFGGGLEFSVPWLSVLVLVVGTFIASMFATAAPAQQASKIKPAIALRMTD